MTPEQISKALDRYITFLADMGEGAHGVEESGYYKPIRFPSDAQNPTEEGALNHVLWMCHEAKKLAVEHPDKAMRWLCFVQGVLWKTGGWTIDEFKDDNR